MKDELKMVTKPKVLEFIAKATRQRRSVSLRDLIRVFGLSQGAACDHLKRLWRARLIQPDEARRKGFEFKLMHDESPMFLTFYLTLRGEKWLQWYRTHRWTRSIRGHW